MKKLRSLNVFPLYLLTWIAVFSVGCSKEESASSVYPRLSQVCTGVAETQTSPTQQSSRWKTVDDYQYTLVSSITDTQPYDMLLQPDGSLLTVGRGNMLLPIADGMGVHMLTRKGTDQGNTWSLISDLDSFNYINISSLPPGQKKAMIVAYSITRAPSGVLFAGGELSSPGGTSGIVLKSTDNGVTWTILSYLVASSGQYGVVRDLAADSLGNLYAAVQYGGTTDTWWVARSTDGGITWTDVDNGYSVKGKFSMPIFVGVDSLGNVFSGGIGVGVNDAQTRWIVRRSTNQGITWTTVDDFSYAGDTTSATVLTDFALDSSGNIYVSGYGTNGSVSPATQNFLIRKSTDHGSTWTTLVVYSEEITFPNIVEVFGGSLVQASDGTFVAAVDRGQNMGLKWDDSTLIRVSTDSGATWSTELEYRYRSDCQNLAGPARPMIRKLVADTNGKVFLAAYYPDETLVEQDSENKYRRLRWVVRRRD
jgi:hypothetical protein